MMSISHRLVLVLLFLPFFTQAASFERYAPKLLKFEGKGYGIHKPLWGDKEFSQQEALEIYRVNYWNKYYGNHFKSQALAEVVIDHLINAGHGVDFQNIKAFQAIIGVPQTGKLTIADIKIANQHPHADELVNSFVKYRVLYYRTRKLAKRYPGWETRARSFFVDSKVEDRVLADYLLPKHIESKYSHVVLES